MAEGLADHYQDLHWEEREQERQEEEQIMKQAEREAEKVRNAYLMKHSKAIRRAHEERLQATRIALVKAQKVVESAKEQIRILEEEQKQWIANP